MEGLGVGYCTEQAPVWIAILNLKALHSEQHGGFYVSDCIIADHEAFARAQLKNCESSQEDFGSWLPVTAVHRRDDAKYMLKQACSFDLSQLLRPFPIRHDDLRDTRRSLEEALTLWEQRPGRFIGSSIGLESLIGLRVTELDTQKLAYTSATLIFKRYVPLLES